MWKTRGGSRRVNRLKSGYRAARGWIFLGVRNDGVRRVELSPDSVCIRQTNALKFRVLTYFFLFLFALGCFFLFKMEILVLSSYYIM